MIDDLNVNPRAVELINELIDLSQDMMKELTPRDIYLALIYGDISEEAATSLVCFFTDMFSSSVKLGLIPEPLVEKMYNQDWFPKEN